MTLRCSSLDDFLHEQALYENADQNAIKRTHSFLMKKSNNDYMNSRDFFSPSSDNESHISPEEAQRLNTILATTSVSDIPAGDRPQVLRYLEAALNVNSIEHDIRPKLESLCSELQQSND